MRLRLVAAASMLTIAGAGCGGGGGSAGGSASARSLLAKALSNTEAERQVHIVIDTGFTGGQLTHVDASYHDGDLNAAFTFSQGLVHVRVVDGYAYSYSPKAVVKARFPDKSTEYVDYFADRWVTAGADDAKSYAMADLMEFAAKLSIPADDGPAVPPTGSGGEVILKAKDELGYWTDIVITTGSKPRLISAASTAGYRESFDQFGTTPPVPPIREGVAP